MPATVQRIPALKDKASVDSGNLIDQLLAEQKQLQTPVARFSEIHHRKEPDLADHYRSLIPLTKPGKEEQYAFEVSLDRCTGCKACVSACHSLNGLDDHEVWRDVGALVAPGWQQTVTTACHHCEDPGCMNGCPVGAYEKDADTGIVRHLDDQCIGCSYCILKCPYDVPKYSKKRGIVRKCDMCHQRLAEGEAPACVQACPTEAIRIVKVSTTENSKPQPAELLGDSSITLPTTRYVGREIPTDAIAADKTALVVQHAHWPLVLMLVLTQAGVGLVAWSTSASPAQIVAGAVIFYSGMLASVFHLGQPLKAWRFFLGLRTSWLSREILAFSLFAPIPFALSVFALLPQFPKIPLPSFLTDLLPLAGMITAYSALPVGLLAVFTSIMIYHDTHRSLWRFPLGAIRFFGTTFCFAALGFAISTPSILANIIFSALVLVKLAPELMFLKLHSAENWTPDVHSSRLQLGPLKSILLGRLLFALLAVASVFIQPWLALPLLLVADLLERQLFFQSVHAPKMPGAFGPAKHEAA